MKVFQEQAIDDQQQMQNWRDNVDTELDIESKDPKLDISTTERAIRRPQNMLDKEALGQTPVYLLSILLLLNYARAGWSQKNFWWRSIAVLQ